MGADGFIGTTLLTVRGGAALATGAITGFAATAAAAFGAMRGVGFAAPPALEATGRSWTIFATGLAMAFATGFAVGFRAGSPFSAGLDPARAGFATAFAGLVGRFAGFVMRFAGLAAGFFAVVFTGAIFFNGFAAAARADGFSALLVAVFAASFFPGRLEFFLVTVFVAKVFSFGRSAAHLT
jgi:hypothetical protein